MVRSITSLPIELIWEICEHLLSDDDGTDYINFRTTCKAFWSSLPGPRNLGFCFLPQSWIMLYKRANNRSNNPPSYVPSLIRIRIGKIENRISGTRTSFIHLPTGRCAKLVCPELETQLIISATCGLLILADKQTGAMRLFNPLTRYLSADLPPTLPMKDEAFSAVTAVAPSPSIVEQPTLMVAMYFSDSAYFAKPGEPVSEHMQLPFYISSALFFKGRFYCTDIGGAIWEIDSEQKSVACVFYQEVCSRNWDLVRTGAEVLLIDTKPRLEGGINDAACNLCVYKVNFDANTIVPTNDIGNYAIFVGDSCYRQQALSVIPTNNYIERNAIYVCCSTSYFYRLKDRSTEFNGQIVDACCSHISQHRSKWHYWNV